MKIKSVNPATNETIKEFDAMTKQDVEHRVAKAREVSEAWGNESIQVRSRYIKKLGRQLLKKKVQYSELMAREMGKPLKEGLPEIEKCALLCDYYARNAKKLLREEHVKTEYKKSFVRFEPIGVIGSIMPWNFPFWQPLRFAVPALIAGNAEVLKHSSSVTMCALAIDDLFKKVKFPEHVFQVVIGDASTGTALAESRIDAISVTGSTQTGSTIGQIALRDIKKVVLELGGSDPFVVLKDADIEKAATGGVAGRFLNCGQSCIAAKRFIVVKDVYDSFSLSMIEKTKALKVGDPLDPETDIGPLVNAKQLELLERQVQATMKEGGKLAMGGKKIDRKGNYFEPTVMTHIKNDMTIAREEAFGPVAPILPVESEDEAFRMANDTEYGLGASIWTNDIARGEQLTRKINSGLVYVNKNVRSDPRLPFGGSKKSGIGRELARYGLLEMCNVKTVIIN